MIRKLFKQKVIFIIMRWRCSWCKAIIESDTKPTRCTGERHNEFFPKPHPRKRVAMGHGKSREVPYTKKPKFKPVAKVSRYYEIVRKV